MSYRGHDSRTDGLPNPVKHQGRWARGKDGTLFKSIFYWGGTVRWVPEGTTQHLGPANGPVITVRILEYNSWERFKTWLSGGIIESS